MFFLLDIPTKEIKLSFHIRIRNSQVRKDSIRMSGLQPSLEKKALYSWEIMWRGPTYKAEEDGAWGLPVPNTAPSPVHEAPLQSTGCESVAYSQSILTHLAPNGYEL